MVLVFVCVYRPARCVFFFVHWRPEFLLRSGACISCVLKAAWCENRRANVNLLKLLNFKMDFFGAETTLCILQLERMSLFEKNKNRNNENPYYSLVLLQQP